MIYPVAILKQPESSYIALAPDWPNLRGTGTSIEDALLSVQEAIAARVKEHIESQTPTPTPRTIEEACREKEYQGGIWAMVEADRVYS
ncbi:type II toxin-antitoxin system HicB family antitoxin, partial [Geoalkalibacter halelectricus]|uniref:type II toxin-antitoxin system HicB family antitoxin n=1 Tax=Geoalkalibacter halelectricus TaxID=2847045 RepID=UPI00266F749F